MPGLILNRLSRPKEGETPEQQLQKGRVILLEEMLPVIHKGAVEGKDYLYKEDIVSRMKSHEEGALLNWALGQMRRGNVAWLAVTEIARITGDLQAFDEILNLCLLHRIKLYTRERVRFPYEPWRAESAQDLWVKFFLARMEIVGYQGRTERSRDTSYPIDAATGEKRLHTFEGIGRHLNGRVPTGYLWDGKEKRVLPANRVPEDVPAPLYVPPGCEMPPAYTWFEIARIVREVGRRYGVVEASRRVFAQTGVMFLSRHLQDIWRNPFYAGRPTLTREMRGKRLMKRETPLSTTGNYPPVDTWEEHLQLQEAVKMRATGNVRTAGEHWASGLLLCACGERFINNGPLYRCGGYQWSLAHNRAKRERTDHGLPKSAINPGVREGWEKTPTCGSILAATVHEHIEKAIKRRFKSATLPAWVARMKAQAEKPRPDLENLRRQEAEVQAGLTKNREALKRARDYLTRAVFSEREYNEQRDALDAERVALESRLVRVREDLSVPAVTHADTILLEAVIAETFDAWWGQAEPQDKATLARLLIDHVPVTGGPGKGQRKLGAVRWR